MIKKIFKYVLPLTSELLVVSMPKGAKILHFDSQRDRPTIWAEVDSWALEDRSFRFLATGANKVEDREHLYIGTALFEEGAFAWHLYEML